MPSLTSSINVHTKFLEFYSMRTNIIYKILTNLLMQKTQKLAMEYISNDIAKVVLVLVVMS